VPNRRLKVATLWDWTKWDETHSNYWQHGWRKEVSITSKTTVWPF